MKDFYLVIIYLIAGGLLAGSVDRQIVKECGSHMETVDTGFLIIAWPGFIAAALITESTGEDVCQKYKERIEQEDQPK